MSERKSPSLWGAGVRDVVARQFTRVEDVVYVGLGILLSGCSLALLVTGVTQFVRSLAAGRLGAEIVEILDRILLILLVVEILYTVQVSFREHTLVPEPFLIVGLIAGTRRVLVLTAEFKELLNQGDAAFRNGMIELGLLSVLILALVISLVLLRRQPAERRPAAAMAKREASNSGRTAEATRALPRRRAAARRTEEWPPSCTSNPGGTRSVSRSAVVASFGKRGGRCRTEDPGRDPDRMPVPFMPSAPIAETQSGSNAAPSKRTTGE